ncbi:hypothetical protein M2323_003469 [Rhodoblastus acidophilus]|nr:hypothetical protein [Rhodoblastus acidophilus]MCW2334528.1 hypothetical protein [Rhodoblastus acidophilus]
MLRFVGGAPSSVSRFARATFSRKGRRVSPFCGIAALSVFHDDERRLSFSPCGRMRREAPDEGFFA